MPSAVASTTPEVAVSLEREGSVSTLRLEGRLDAQSTGQAWRRVFGLLDADPPARVIVEAEGIDYCDGVGAGLLVEIERRQRERGAQSEVRGMREEVRRLLALFDPESLGVPASAQTAPARRKTSFLEQLGRGTVQLADDLAALVAYVGELGAALVHAVRHPLRVRWRDVLVIAEQAGVNALPILIVINFLVGLIIAFEAAQALRLFGAEVYVANLVALSSLRELAPLMTAILLAGRSGSAFAAELGTMTVNEEVAALRTMGLDPLRFLATPRVIAGVLVIPVLTLVADAVALMGGAVVFKTLGFPLVMYIQQVQEAVAFSDLLVGLFKAFIFGILVAAIGCLRGLQTGTGASAVGISATRAVVSGLFLIVFADGIFSVVFHILKI